MGSKCAPKGSVNSVRSVREKTPQRVTCVSSHRVGAFYFSQKNTEEQNTQGFTETLSQPISQNLTAILEVTLCDICMPKAFCGLETVRQKAP